MAGTHYMKPPPGYKLVESGAVALGDVIWSAASGCWIDVTPQVLNDLGFLDAIVVDELHAVARPEAKS